MSKKVLVFRQIHTHTHTHTYTSVYSCISEDNVLVNKISQNLIFWLPKCIVTGFRGPLFSWHFFVLCPKLSSDIWLYKPKHTHTHTHTPVTKIKMILSIIWFDKMHVLAQNSNNCNEICHLAIENLTTTKKLVMSCHATCTCYCNEHDN